MDSVEKIVYEAHALGLRDELFEKIDLLRFDEKYRYSELKVIYQESLNQIKMELV